MQTAIQDIKVEECKISLVYVFIAYVFIAVFTDALPEIVDRARKISQGGKRILVSARGSDRRSSLLPMLEATTSSNRDRAI